MDEVFVVSEHCLGDIQKATYEVIEAARRLSEFEQTKIVLILIGDGSYLKELSEVEVDEIIVAEIAFSRFCHKAYAEILKDLVSTRKPKRVLVADTVYSSEYVPCLINSCKILKLQKGINDIREENEKLIFTRNYFNENVRADFEITGLDTNLLVIQPGAFSYTEGKGDPKITYTDYTEIQPVRQDVEYLESIDERNINIEQAEVLLAIGRGVKSQKEVEKFASLADQAGAGLVCSRPIKDFGWLPKSRLIGYSGFSPTKCRLYVAFGISGSIHHVAGLKHVETIVAVNTDANAAIFDVADYGLIEDLNLIADKLIKKFSDKAEKTHDSASSRS